MLFTASRAPLCSAGPSAPARAYVCRHLASGASGLGLCYDTDSRSPWPDLRCDACRAEPRGRRSLRPVCGFCWDDIFGRNTKVQNANAGAFLSESFRRGHERHHRWAHRYGIAQLTRWVLDLEGKHPRLGLGLPRQERLHVVCAPVVIGSFNPEGGDWLWGWGNDSLRATHYAAVVRLKRLGEKLGLEPLWRSHIFGEEMLALHLSMIALDALRGCEGVYRVVQPNGTAIFLGVKETRTAGAA
jgi:hypothetical protein